MREGWSQKTLGEICTITKGTSATMKTRPGRYPLVVTAALPSTSSEYQFDGEAVCIPMVSSTGHGHASLKRVHYAKGKFAVANIIAAAQVKDHSAVSTKFLALYLQHFKDELIVTRMRGTANVSLSLAGISTIPVELPPFDEQRRIVDLIGSLDEGIEAAEGAVLTARAAASDLRRELQSPREGWNRLSLKDVFLPVSDKLGAHQEEPPVFSISKHDGVVLSTDYHDRRIASAKLDGYKVLAPEEWAYSTIHIDEGSIARNLHGFTGVVSPMYTILRWNDDRLNPAYFERLLRSPEMLTVYGDLAQGSINRRRSLSWSVFSSIEVHVPELQAQQSIVEVLEAAEGPVRQASIHAQSLRNLRSELLTVLLSGEHEIPESYDADTTEPVAA